MTYNHYDIHTGGKSKVKFDEDGRIKRGFEKLKEAWEENPIMVIAVGAAAMTAGAKLIDSISAIQGRRAYARMSKRSMKKAK